MTYEEIWNRLRSMNFEQRDALIYEMRLCGLSLGTIRPFRYPQEKWAHFVDFYAEDESLIEDDKKYYDALQAIMEDDSVVHIPFKRYAWLPRFVNDRREAKLVESVICSRVNQEYINHWYRILPGDTLAGNRPRSLFLTMKDGSEVVYKMTECSHKKGYDILTFTRFDK